MTGELSGPPNRLAQATSPYLRLHARNPVDWYGWGEEAFERARREEKPVFLSVGYSTCHWCHVMARESFSMPEIARQLNRDFVSVKLDREERPDLDEVYMAATQILTGSGGWPNSLFLTPDLKPFFAGTYFPPDDLPGRPGFRTVLTAVREAWDQRRSVVLQQADAITRAVREHLRGTTRPLGRPSGAATAERLQAALAGRFDSQRGGFGGAPKFPSPSILFFLLDRARGREIQARHMLLVTLDAMARGGIHDHLGGGFHRYSTDAEWLVPHFEKMLYDNAALAELFAEASTLAPEKGFDRVARTTLDFVLAELTGEAGGFLSAIDAETEGEEGTYYTFAPDEVEAVLRSDAGALFAELHGLNGEPSFEGRRYVLHWPQSLAEQARRLGMASEDLKRRFEPERQKLLAVRERRPRPSVDDKVLTDWNGLMIAAMARCSTVLSEPRYLRAATRAAEFILDRLRRSPDGGLFHAFWKGEARVPAMLDDYAFLVRGLLALHTAARDKRWLVEARRLVEEQDRRLRDSDAGGYFAAPDDPRLLVRAKPAQDGATLSGNGVAALNLVELSRASGEQAYQHRSTQILDAFGSVIDEEPYPHPTLVMALLRLEGQAASAARPALARAKSLAAEADAVVRATVLWGEVQDGWRRFVLDLDVSDGWHLNANPPGDDSLIATDVQARGARLRNLRYPLGRPSGGASGSSPLLYSGRIAIEGEAEVLGEVLPTLVVTYQACDQARCLPPRSREVHPA